MDNQNPECSELQDHSAASKVHFQVDQVAQHDSEIIVKAESDNRIAVHLGFLEINHVYEVKFSIKDSLNEDITYDPLENLHAKIANYMPTEDGEGHDLVVDLCAYKEKLMKEALTIKDSQDPSKTITITLNARVLGKGKGTPMLKRGIHCTGINAEEESEQSDWQGFD